MAVSAVSAALKTLFRAKEAAGKYTDLVLGESEIARGDYKRHLGGGDEMWEARGRFQLDLMRSRGLEACSTLLDIGCGPLRAGIHLIRYLDAGNYYGFDYNTSFVAAAEKVISENGLAEKYPTVVTLRDFDLGRVERRFDYAIAFSVLNHCSETQRRLFFANVGRCLAPGGKLFISHARWLTDADLVPARLAVLQQFEAADLDLAQYGWPTLEQRSVCPIYELVKITD